MGKESSVERIELSMDFTVKVTVPVTVEIGPQWKNPSISVDLFNLDYESLGERPDSWRLIYLVYNLAERVEKLTRRSYFEADGALACDPSQQSLDEIKVGLKETFDRSLATEKKYLMELYPAIQALLWEEDETERNRIATLEEKLGRPALARIEDTETLKADVIEAMRKISKAGNAVTKVAVAAELFGGSWPGRGMLNEPVPALRSRLKTFDLDWNDLLTTAVGTQ